MMKLAKNEEETKETLVIKANDLIALKRYPEALLFIEETLKIDPKYHLAIINKGLVLKKLGRLPEIEDTLKVLIQSIENDYYKAGVYALINEKDNMLTSLKKALSNDLAQTVISALFDPIFEDYKRNF